MFSSAKPLKEAKDLVKEAFQVCHKIFPDFAELYMCAPPIPPPLPPPHSSNGAVMGRVFLLRNLKRILLI